MLNSPPPDPAADAAHAEQAVAVEAGCLAGFAEVVHDHVVGEVVVAGRHRRVRGEHRVGRHRLQRGGERHALAATSSRMRSSTRKAAWPSLMCQTVGLQPQRGERAHAADAEQDFLLDAGAPVAAVELVRNPAVGFAVLSSCGVEQIQAVVADAGAPDLGPHHAPGEGTPTRSSLAVGAAHRPRSACRRNRCRRNARSGCRRGRWSGGNSPAGRAGRRRRRAGAGRGALAVVAGEDAEAARIDRQAFMEAELGAEVGDQVVRLQRRLARQLQPGFGMIGIVGRQHPVHGAEEDRVVGGLVDSLLVHALEEGLRAVVHRATGRPRAREQRARGPVPAVPEVVGEFVQAHRRAGISGLTSSW
jgi:hypothetical protein